jgi:protein-L-isoaspartate(D-aspartate) O-methyltransferase
MRETAAVSRNAGIFLMEGKLLGMNDLETEQIALDPWRRFYAEEVQAVANLKSPLLVEALATVPREAFLGEAPWHFSSQAPSKDGAYRTTGEVRDLYHDVMVALKPDLRLNNGLPSLIAGCLDRLNLAPGDRILHIGCGTGYYTAIMATIAGPRGSVLALEIDPDLAALAKTNLGGYSNVAVENRDGTEFAAPHERFDAILVNAAVTHPSPWWLSSLHDGGRIVLPLAAGDNPTSSKALFVVVEKRGSHLQADLHSVSTIYPSPSLFDPERRAKLSKSLSSRAIGRLRSVRLEPHAEDEHCLMHTPGFCLSAQAVLKRDHKGLRMTARGYQHRRKG